MAQEFRSEGWFSEVDRIQNEVNPPVPPAIKDLKINMQVTGAPSGDVSFRMDAGKLVKGHAADAPTKLVIPFATAKASRCCSPGESRCSQWSCSPSRSTRWVSRHSASARPSSVSRNAPSADG